jgi:hypothetical protein
MSDGNPHNPKKKDSKHNFNRNFHEDIDTIKFRQTKTDDNRKIPPASASLT